MSTRDRPTAESMVVCYSTEEYRRAAVTLPCASDNVMEVGSAHGVTSDMLAARCRRVLGVDKGKPEIEAARGRYQRQNMSFCMCDALDTDAILAAWQAVGGEGRSAAAAATAAAVQSSPAQRPFDYIFVDVSGVASLGFLLPLLESLQAAWRPPVLVVKSKRLARLKDLCTNGDHVFPEALIANAGTSNLLQPPLSRRFNRDGQRVSAYFCFFKRKIKKTVLGLGQALKQSAIAPPPRTALSIRLEAVGTALTR